jgi:hypothetical protein
MTPRLPLSWEKYTLEKLHFGEAVLTIKIQAVKDRLRVTVFNPDRKIYDKTVLQGEVISVHF